MSNEEKIKIAFEPLNVWDKDDFRKLIKSLYEDDCYEISIITNSFDVEFLDKVKSDIAENANITVTMYTNYDSLVEVLDTNKIQLYLNDDNKTILFIDAMALTTRGILVNAIQDTYKSQPKYISKLQFWINYIKKGESLGKSCE